MDLLVDQSVHLWGGHWDSDSGGRLVDLLVVRSVLHLVDLLVDLLVVLWVFHSALHLVDPLVHNLVPLREQYLAQVLEHTWAELWARNLDRSIH